MGQHLKCTHWLLMVLTDIPVSLHKWVVPPWSSPVLLYWVHSVLQLTTPEMISKLQNVVVSQHIEMWDVGWCCNMETDPSLCAYIRFAQDTDYGKHNNVSPKKVNWAAWLWCTFKHSDLPKS